MRRKDRETSKEFALKLLEDCEYAVLASVNPDGSPYNVPISLVMLNGYIYFHCALVGKKLDNIMHEKRVCITCVGQTKLVPENFSTEYESAIATGICEIIEEDAEKIDALRSLCIKYAKGNMQSFDSEMGRSFKRTGICRITIKEVTGKSKGFY